MADFTMYTTTWCGDCINLKRQLARTDITYEEIDIEQDEQAMEICKSINNGRGTIPTLVFADGSTLTEPTLAEVKERLASLA